MKSSRRNWPNYFRGRDAGGSPDSKWSHLARRRSQTLPLRARKLISAGSAGDARSAVMRSRRRSTGRWGRGQSALPIVAPQLCFGEVLARVRFVAFPRTDLAGLRALPRVAALPLRAAARFFRWAMTAAFAAECTQFGAPFYISR